SHRGHRSLEKSDVDLRTGNWRAIGARELDADGITSLARRLGIGRELQVSSRRVDGGCRCTGAGLWRREGAECRLELTFRINQKIGRRDDVLTGFEPFEHNVIVPDPRTQLDFARLETSAPLIHECNLPGPGLKHPARRNHFVLAHWHAKGNIDEHAGFELERRIPQCEPYARGTR